MAKPKPEQLPTFQTYEEAGAFWDTHDLGDYWHLTKPVQFEVDLKRTPKSKSMRVDAKLHSRLRRMADQRHVSMTKLVNQLLADQLANL